MQTLNIVSSLNSQNSAAKTIKSNPVVNADNSFNKLLKKEINGNKATSTPPPGEANSKLTAKNVEPAKQDSAAPSEDLNSTTTAPKKSEDVEKEDNQTEKKDTNDSDHQLIQLFNALNDISNLAPPKSGADVTIKSANDAIKTVLQKSDADASIKSETGIGTITSGLSLQPLNEKKTSPSVEASKEATFDVIVNNTLSARVETPHSALTSKTSITSEIPVADASLVVKDKEIGSDVPTSFIDHLDVKSEKGEPLKLQTNAQQDVLPKTGVSGDKSEEGEPLKLPTSVQQDVLPKTGVSGDKLERSVDKFVFSVPKDETISPISVQQSPPQQQLNAAQNATITGAATANQISSPLNSSAWDKAVGQKVIWMVGESMQSAELTLNPPDLGPLQIVLNVTNDQANATFISAHPDVREALEASLPKLRQMMDDAGVQLLGFSVNAEASNQGQQGREFRQTNPSTSISRNGGSESVISNQPISDVKTTKITSRIGTVDTFA